MVLINSKKSMRVIADYLPRHWGSSDFTTDTNMSSYGFEDFIHPETCQSEEDFRNKVCFLEHGQYIQKLDIFRSVNQWQRFLLFRQNREFKNKFWLANYAAELDKNFFREEKKSDCYASEFPIPIRATFYIENRWQELKDLYIRELEITQANELESLIHEDTLAELSYSGLNQKRFLQDLTVRHLMHSGLKPEEITMNKINSRLVRLKTITKAIFQPMKIHSKEHSEYLYDDFIDIHSNKSSLRDHIFQETFYSD